MDQQPCDEVDYGVDAAAIPQDMLDYWWGSQTRFVSPGCKGD
jgi:hypothetical protein